MKFTDKIPTEPGYYWAVFKALSDIEEDGEPSTVLLCRYIGPEGGYWIVRCIDMSPYKAEGFLWGDRIPEPEVEE